MTAAEATAEGVEEVVNVDAPAESALQIRRRIPCAPVAWRHCRAASGLNPCLRESREAVAQAATLLIAQTCMRY